MAAEKSEPLRRHEPVLAEICSAGHPAGPHAPMPAKTSCPEATVAGGRLTVARKRGDVRAGELGAMAHAKAKANTPATRHTARTGDELGLLILPLTRALALTLTLTLTHRR